MRTKSWFARFASAAVVASLALTNPVLAMQPSPVHPDVPRPKVASSVLYRLKLADKSTATVYADGLAMIVSSDRKSFRVRHLAANLQDRTAVRVELNTPAPKLYAPNRILVAFDQSVGVPHDTMSVPAKTLLALRTSMHDTSPTAAGVPSYTSDAYVNTALARLGADQMNRIARKQPRFSVAPLIARAFVIHLTDASVMQAVNALRTVRGVAFAEPDWAVTPLAETRETLSNKQVEQSRTRERQVAANAFRQPATGFSSMAKRPAIPKNYAVQANAQPMLAATGTDAIAAYDVVKSQFGQYPGQGEIVTDISLGDITDVTAPTNFNDPCQSSAGLYGPTTNLIAGKHYIDLPSLPLIPAYAAQPDGTLTNGEVCNTGDPMDTEIGLDFSMMAALPHNLQRGGAVGSGYTDLLGIAPGATYRLVVPAQAYISTMVAAFTAAADQKPKPNVIVASFGFGYDSVGFPGRYFEEDPLVASAVESIVHDKNIVVCLSANDGTRTYTNAAVGPTGGSTPTNAVTSASQETALSDVALSTVPSSVIDTGAIDVGGTTTDDISAVNPSDPLNAARPNVRTVAETRYTGFTSFSSGFGSRVNVAAPSDNVIALEHAIGGYNDVSVVISGGTSAAAPETAAAAAIALQVGRLTNHPFQKATDVREALEKSGTVIPRIPQEDQNVHLGRQIDVGNLVTSLIDQSGRPFKPQVTHVSVMQRDSAAFDDIWNGGRYVSMLDTTFTTDTDPGAIDIEGPTDTNTGMPNGMRMDDYITIAPDWEGLPANARYQLVVGRASKPPVIATTRSARVLPAQLLKAAGLPIVSPSAQSVPLTYRALQGQRVLAQATLTLTFSPSQKSSERVFAPDVTPVTTGPTMRISYDYSNFPPALLANPELVILHPGRVNTLTGEVPYPSYIKPLRAPKGTIEVPVSALQGDGIYGIGLQLNDMTALFSDFAYTRIQTAPTHVRPPAPEFIASVAGQLSPSHYLALPYGGKAKISYDVSSVPNATGAILEVSAAGPTIYGSENPIDNPNGSIVDYNGIDTGSVFAETLGGTKGTVTLTAAQLHLIPTLEHVVRVIPLTGASAAGEASDVSFITEDGGANPDGGSAYGGFAVTPSGNYGLSTSAQPLADGEWLTSVYRFQQNTMAMSSAIAQKDGGYDRYTMPGNGLFAGNAGLFATTWDPSYVPSPPDPIPTYEPPTFQYMSNAKTATAPSGAWTPTLGTPTTNVVGAGINSAPGKAAFVIRDTGSLGDSGLAAFVSDVGNDTFGAEIPLTSVFSSFGFSLGGFDYDSSTNMGYAGGNQDFLGRISTPIAAIDFTAGTASLLMDDSCTDMGDMAIDPGLHLAFVSSGGSNGCALHFIDLVNKQTITTSLPSTLTGVQFWTVADDPVNHLFFAEAPLSPDAGYNNNSLSSIYVLNSSGTQIEALEEFSFPRAFNTLRINGKTHRGFVSGYDGAQIQPFAY